MTQNDKPTIKEILDNAAAAIKHGDIASGKASLARVLQMEPDNVWAWLWMSRCFQDSEKKLQCFRRVLRIDPNNEHALEGIRLFSPSKQDVKEDFMSWSLEETTENSIPQHEVQDHMHSTYNFRENTMTRWQFAEVITTSPSTEASVWTFGLVKGSATFILHGNRDKSGEIDLKKVSNFIATLGQNGWYLISSTESLKPNNWLKTRWVFMRSIDDDASM